MKNNEKNSKIEHCMELSSALYGAAGRFVSKREKLKPDHLPSRICIERGNIKFQLSFNCSVGKNDVFLQFR